MLTDRGLMLNLRKKTGQWFAEAAGKFTHANKTRTNHLERSSSASRGAGYKERIRISTDTTEEDGFFRVNVFT